MYYQADLQQFTLMNAAVNPRERQRVYAVQRANSQQGGAVLRVCERQRATGRNITLLH